jgi:hypothetical protein
MCNPKGPTIVHVAKLFPKPDCSAFDAFGRVICGTIRPGQRVRVLGEGYTPEDEEDSTSATVSAVWVYQARYRVPLARGVAGRPSSPLPLPTLSFFYTPSSCTRVPVGRILPGFWVEWVGVIHPRTRRIPPRRPWWWLYQARYQVPLARGVAGGLFLPCPLKTLQ